MKQTNKQTNKDKTKQNKTKQNKTKTKQTKKPKFAKILGRSEKGRQTSFFF